MNRGNRAKTQVHCANFQKSFAAAMRPEDSGAATASAVFFVTYVSLANWASPKQPESRQKGQDRGVLKTATLTKLTAN